MPYIITSLKKDIRAISGTNNDVEFHNKLFDTDDCVIAWEEDPTPEQIETMKAQMELDAANKPKEKTLEERVAELETKSATIESRIGAFEIKQEDKGLV